MRRPITSAAAALAVAALGLVMPGPASATDATPTRQFPASIALPDGFAPEGMTIDDGHTVYVGSMWDGAVWRGDLRTGQGAIFIPGTPGTDRAGLKVDAQHRLWTADFSTGGASVYDARTGQRLAHYPFGGGLINDLAITHDAVYFTDSTRPVLYAVPLGPGGRLPEDGSFRTLTLSGPAGAAGAFNNGIVALPDGDVLVVQMLAGRLVRVDTATGLGTLVDLGGYSASRGDGLVLGGRALYIIRNLTNVIAEFRMDTAFTSGTLVREITSPALRIPATGDLFGPWLYAVNGRFDTDPAPDTDYDIVQLPA